MLQWMKRIKEFAQRFRLTETKKDRAILMTCIGIAFVFWVLVKLSQPYTSECEILLDYDLPEDKVLRETPPEKITATLKGNGWDLFREYRNNGEREVRIDVVEDRNYLNINELINNINLQDRLIIKKASSSDRKVYFYIFYYFSGNKS